MSKRKGRNPTKDNAVRRELGTAKYRQRVKPGKKKETKTRNKRNVMENEYE